MSALSWGRRTFAHSWCSRQKYHFLQVVLLIKQCTSIAIKTFRCKISVFPTATTAKKAIHYKKFMIEKNDSPFLPFRMILLSL